MRLAEAGPTRSPDAAAFTGWLATRRLSARTRATYAERAGQFLAWLAAGGGTEVVGDPLTDPEAFTDAARDWRRELLRVRAAPATVNLSLAALVALGECLGLGVPDVARVDEPVRAPRALTEDEARLLLRTARRASVRDRAVVNLLCGTGLRLAEAAALEVDDVPTTDRTGAVHVRAGKGERPRTVPLSTDARTQLRAWLKQREQHPAARAGEPALWLGRRGRLSPRQLQRVVTDVGAAAGLGVSAHTLRHTAATRWLRAGVDVVVVAGLLGHSSLETTRTYTRPSDRELAAAVEAGAVDY